MWVSTRYCDGAIVGPTTQDGRTLIHVGFNAWGHVLTVEEIREETTRQEMKALTNSLQGRTYIIFGGSRGIGRAITQQLLAAQANVVVTGRSADSLRELEALPEAATGHLTWLAVDSVNEDTITQPLEVATEKYGRIHGMVTTVGGHVGDDRNFPQHDYDVFLKGLELNLGSAFLSTRAMSEYLVDNNYSGSIVTIGSGDSRFAGRRLTYTTAKHGLVGLTKGLALRLAPHDIRVNCLCPGWTDTSLNDWTQISKAWGTSVEEAQHFASSQSLQHRILDAEEVASMAVFLLSDASSGMTGQIVSVDGGYKV